MLRQIKHIALVFAVIVVRQGFAQTAAIPDTEFLKYLKANYASCIDSKNQLILTQAATFSDSLIMKNLNIKSVEGIQYFTNIRGINLTGNLLTSLPKIGRLGQLQTLNVRNNQLTALPALDSLKNLTNIYADNNALTTLPTLSANLKLLSIQVSYNQIQTLPSLSTLNKVNILDVSHNKLTSLPSLSGLVALERLYCAGNKLTALPSLSNLSNLKRINISRNLFANVQDLSANTLLSEFVADSNLLTSTPDLSNLKGLTKIQIQNNFLTFDDLVRYLNHSNFSAMSYDYSPQRNTSKLNITNASLNDAVTIMPNNTDTLTGLVYSWYHKGTFLVKSTTKNYQIPSVVLSDSGNYYCKITYPSLPSLTLISDTTSLRIKNVVTSEKCPTLAYPTIKATKAYCTELASIDLTFMNNLLDSIKVELYDSQKVFIAGTSKTLFTGLRQGNYNMVIKPSNAQCADFLEKKITIANETCDEVVLTPNNDGKDDTLYLSQKGTATIFDKNGKTVKTLSIPTEWDGTNSEGTLPQGYYLVKINNGADYIHVSVIY